MRLFRILLSVVFFACVQTGYAHKASDSYLNLKVTEDRIEGRWDIAVRDLDYAIGLDANSDGAITWGELRGKRGAVYAYAFSRLKIGSGTSRCRIAPKHFLVDHHTDGAYSVVPFDVNCEDSSPTLTIDYSLLFDLDPQHRGLLRIDYRDAVHSAVFGPDNGIQTIELGKVHTGAVFMQYLREGIRHIWLGYDHILFLLSLLLPSVLLHQNGQWLPAGRFRPVLVDVVKIVTAFTVAHSITLSLATLDFVALPSRWVESAIAASVILAALNNLYPLITKKLWLVAFGFGLMHGLGFATVLKDLGLPQNMLLLTLLAFNLGVEIGQLAIVCGFMPAAYRLRHAGWYPKIIVTAGSVFIAAIASVWLLERSFDLKLLAQ
ncbi:MAG: HupE/UreJ family protein [Gammaproteobacteria bacterium]